MGHTIINIIPVYKDENLNSERKKATESELKNLQAKLQVKKRTPRPKKTPQQKLDKLPKAPKRFP